MKTKHYPLSVLAIAICFAMSSQTSTIRKDLMSFKKQTTQNQTSTSNTNNKPAANIEKEAERLDLIAKQIKAASANRPTAEKALMLEEAADLQKAAVMEKIKATELSIKVKEQHYNLNNQTLTALMNAGKKNIDVLDRAENYRIDARMIWKMAKEMLEEANAQTESEAKLGMMSNAEEEEVLALVKQSKAISLLTTSTTQVTLLPVNYVCVR